MSGGGASPRIIQLDEGWDNEIKVSLPMFVCFHYEYECF
jgi:hypothetical protein